MAVEYAAELKLVTGNRIGEVNWTVPKSVRTIDKRTVINHEQARKAALSKDEYASPLGKRPYDLRHACVSTWLAAGRHRLSAPNGRSLGRLQGGEPRDRRGNGRGHPGLARRCRPGSRKPSTAGPATSVDDRADMLVRLREVIAGRAEEFAALITREQGSPPPVARKLHVDTPLAVIDRTADALTAAAGRRTRSGGDPVLRPDPGGVRRRGAGRRRRGRPGHG